MPQTALRRDVPAMTVSLCDAFADDPTLVWLWPNRDDRLRRLPYFFRAVVQGSRRHGVALHTAGSDAVSLWRPPGRVHPGPLEILQGLPSMAKAFSAGRERSKALSKVLREHQPQDRRWWYLQFIGVRGSAQGSGLGGAVLRDGLALADAASDPVYVEVMEAGNLAFYRHAGFEVVDTFDLPDGGPRTWTMLRPARAAT